MAQAQPEPVLHPDARNEPGKARPDTGGRRDLAGGQEKEADALQAGPGVVATKSQVRGAGSGVLAGGIIGTVAGAVLGMILFSGLGVIITTVCLAVSGAVFGGVFGGIAGGAGSEEKADF